MEYSESELPPMLMDSPNTLKYIKNAWQAGALMAGLTAVVSGAAILGYDFLGVGVWGIVDAIPLGGFAFGVYKRSRVCAILLFMYFVVGKGIMIAMGQGISGVAIGIAIGFGIAFLLGIVGTFQYHKVLQNYAAEHGVLPS